MVTRVGELPPIPALVQGTVHHVRHRPFHHGLHFRTYQWLIDVDAPPALGPVAAFRVRDHFGGGAGSLREAVRAFVEAQGGTIADDERILMLAGGRAFGHAFDPLSVFWGLAPDGEVRWAVLEIHNTYGERHAHAVHPTEGRARLTKAFYVSPFFPVSGDYAVHLELYDSRAVVAIGLEQDGERVFNASFAGTPVPVTTMNVVRAMFRTPFVTWQTSARIRMHGIWLWLRRLPVIPKPNHEPQAGFL